MPDPDVEHVVQFVATHAVLLLVAGLVAAAIVLAALVGIVRIAARSQAAVLRIVAALVTRAGRIPVARHLMERFAALVPSTYVAVHLAIGMTVVLAVTAFVVVAHETLGDEGEMAAFDLAFARALHAETTSTGLRIFSTISWLGSSAVLTVVTLVVAAALLVKRLTVLAVGWTGAQAGGAVLNAALKEAFARTRPEFADPVLAASSWSFPSGHAMGTFIACGVAAYLLLRERRSWTRVCLVLVLALMWSCVMAFSRLYLGVHFVSDVIAGLVGGVAWVGVCISAMEIVHRRNNATPTGSSRTRA